jgi:general secretion pathway protein K
MTHPNRARERGVALLLVLWIFIVLGTLALDFGRYMRDDAQAAVNFADETRGYYLALAGMNRALFVALESLERRSTRRRGQAAGGGAAADGEEDDEALEPTPVDGEWHRGTFAGGEFEVRMADEGARIPINRLGPFVLTQVITNLVTGGDRTQGIDQRTAADMATVVDSILDWKDGDNLKRVKGAENDYYLNLRNPYQAKNGFIDSPEELLAVRGMTAELFYGGNGFPGLRDVISIFNRTGFVNARSVKPPVLQALLGIPRERAEAITSQCGQGSCLQVLQTEALAVDPRLANRFGEEEPHTILIETRADTRYEQARATVAAVVELSGDEIEGMRVLRWLDRAPWAGGIPGAPSPEEGDA